MDRRKFLAGAAGLTLGTLSGAGAARGQAREGQQLLEFRTYRFKTQEKQKVFDDLLDRVVIPALNRSSVKPVGVFRLLKEDNPQVNLPDWSHDLYVLLPHNTPESLILLIERLASDQAFLEGGGALWDAPKSDPIYTRYESSLFLGFKDCPRVEVPTAAATRLFQLRIYESHSTERAMKKIEMFNEGGEIGIFRNTGLNPIFFGQALIGSKLPNLTYMLGFEDQAAMDKAWGKFRDHPDWVRLRNDEAYKDTVSGITNLILRPAASSQV